MKKIIICCGTGGVGKTTLSAAIALSLAQHKLNTHAITLDPSARLLKSFTSNHPLLTLSAPDPEKELAEFLKIPSLLENPLFKTFAKEFSGIQNYISIQKIASSIKSTDFDVIVIDTPPGNDFINILHTPDKLIDFLENYPLFHWFKPIEAIGSKSFNIMIETLSYLTQSDLIDNLKNFAKGLFESREQLIEKLNSVKKMLQSDLTHKVLISTPSQLKKNDLIFNNTEIMNSYIMNRTFSDYINIEAIDPLEIDLKRHAENEKKQLTQFKELVKSPVFLITEQPELIDDWQSLERFNQREKVILSKITKELLS